MHKINMILFLLILFFKQNFCLQAMYVPENKGKQERIKRLGQCKEIFLKFVKSEKFEKIFHHIVFDDNKCCRVLFNENCDLYKAWLDTQIQTRIVQIEDLCIEKLVTLRAILESMGREKNGIELFKLYKEQIAEKIANFFYEDCSRKINWYDPTAFDYGDSICLCGFIEILNMLYLNNFYFESYNEDFALRCRIFVLVFVVLFFTHSYEIASQEIGKQTGEQVLYVKNYLIRD